MFLCHTNVFLDADSASANFVSYVLQHRKPADSMLVGCSSRSPSGDGPVSPKYSDRLSPAINNYLSEASRQEVRVITFCI